MKKMTKLIALFVVMFSLMFANTSLLTSTAQVHAAACDVSGGVPGANCKSAGKDVNAKILSFGGALSGVVVGIALLMIIYGGFKYVTSQGDPKATESAKSQIMFAGIGMLIVMTAFVIMKLFIGATDGDGSV
ncbi:hypothetical protein CN918_27545 [Priestia megaterium]|nr:hypothetical protein CN918_27545 [Priestia megaterium]